MDSYGIVRDSSIWHHPETMAAHNRVDGLIRVGVVKAVFNDTATGELRYLVSVNSNGRDIDTNCTMLRRFGGVYNYEDYISRGYSTQDSPDSIDGYNALPGDAVLVGQLNGQGREGVILGGLTHAARTTTIQATDGPQYDAEFNGIHTNINANGEWTLTFKGQPTNLAQLNSTPSNPIPPATYNTVVGGSYMKFDAQGGWTISDAAQSNPQSIVINKAGGTLTLTSGAASITMTKSSQEIDVACKVLNINASNSITESTNAYSLSATNSANVTTSDFTLNASSSTTVTSSQMTFSGSTFSVTASTIMLNGAVTMGGSASSISVGSGSTIKIGNSSTTLGTILTELMTQLAIVATALEGNPVLEPAAFAGGTALTAATTAVQLLITELLT